MAFKIGFTAERPDGAPEEDCLYIWEHEDLGGENWRPVAKSMEELITRYYNDEI